MNTYDVVTVGGGLAGATLAGVMARHGARVLVLERETTFTDRVRGEALFPWGAAELDRLGFRRTLLSACAVENRWWDDFLGGEQIGRRDTVADTPGGMATMTFHHPAMQTVLLDAAAGAGAEVRRGVTVSGVTAGRPPRVTFDWNGGTETVAARLVVGADGRRSQVRRWAGLVRQEDPPRLRIAGVLLDGMTAVPADASRMAIQPERGQSAILLPQGGGRVRAYVVFPAQGDRRLQGDRDLPRFIDEAVRTGIPRELFAGARQAGPLATFDGAASWTVQPYRDGVALIGDAAATCDPAWGQGLSKAVRDVRLLSDALAGDDWDAAGRAYALAHDRGFATTHATEGWFTSFFLDTGPDADARRVHALALIAEDPTRVPDALMSGPDAAPATDEARRRFFGEDRQRSLEASHG